MRWVLIILISFFLKSLVAQNKDLIEDIEYVTPFEIMPKWSRGTNQELIEKIKSTIKYPNEQCLEGTTLLQFIVDKLGKVKEPKIIRSISKQIDRQLLKVICRYEFEPGILIDKKVDFLVTLPISVSKI